MVKNLRRLRMSKGISQQRLADVLGISQQAIYKYEKQKIEPDIGTLIVLADFFGTTVDFLIGHEPGPATDELPDFDLTQEEWDHLRRYRQLSASQKKSISLVIQNYLEK